MKIFTFNNKKDTHASSKIYAKSGDSLDFGIANHLVITRASHPRSALVGKSGHLKPINLMVSESNPLSGHLSYLDTYILNSVWVGIDRRMDTK